MVIKVSHITHIDNLASIMREGCLWSDAKRIQLGESEFSRSHGDRGD